MDQQATEHLDPIRTSTTALTTSQRGEQAVREAAQLERLGEEEQAAQPGALEIRFTPVDQAEQDLHQLPLVVVEQVPRQLELETLQQQTQEEREQQRTQVADREREPMESQEMPLD